MFSKLLSKIIKAFYDKEGGSFVKNREECLV